MQIADGVSKGDEALPTGDSENQTLRFGSGGPGGSFPVPTGSVPGGGQAR